MEEDKSMLSDKELMDFEDIDSFLRDDAPCNMVLTLPKTFKTKPGQPSQLVGDVKDIKDSVVVFAEIVIQFRPNGRSISIEQGD